MRNLRLSLPNTNEQISIVNEIRGLYNILNQSNAQTLYSKQLKQRLINGKYFKMEIEIYISVRCTLLLNRNVFFYKCLGTLSRNKGAEHRAICRDRIP